MRDYADCLVELFDYREGTPATCKVRVAQSPVGAQRIGQATTVEIGDLDDYLGQLEYYGRIDNDGAIELGKALAAMLLPPGVRDLFDKMLGRLAPRQGLRIRLSLDHPRLKALPWEFVYCERPDDDNGIVETFRGFVVLDRRVSLVRHEVFVPLFEAPGPFERGHIEFVAVLADVDDPAYEPLDIEAEQRGIRAGVGARLRYNAQYLRPGTFDQFAEACRVADILHFTGHGIAEETESGVEASPGSAGKIVFSKSEDDRSADLVEAELAARQVSGQHVRLVVLSACELGKRDALGQAPNIAPALIHQGVQAVLAMQYPVEDEAAANLARYFYRDLAEGGTIEEALSDARLKLYAKSEFPNFGVPALYLAPGTEPIFRTPGLANVNVTLAAASGFTVGYWYLVHVQPIVEDTSWIALSMTPLVAMVGGAWYAYRYVKENFDGWIGRMLSRYSWRRPLGAMLLVALTLLTSTRSLYLSESTQAAGVEVFLGGCENASVEPVSGIFFDFPFRRTPLCASPDSIQLPSANFFYALSLDVDADLDKFYLPTVGLFPELTDEQTRNLSVQQTLSTTVSEKGDAVYIREAQVRGSLEGGLILGGAPEGFLRATWRKFKQLPSNIERIRALCGDAIMPLLQEEPHIASEEQMEYSDVEATEFFLDGELAKSYDGLPPRIAEFHVVCDEVGQR